MNLTHEKTRRGKTEKDTVRHEKTRKIHYKMRKDRLYIDNRLFFFLAWKNHRCRNLKSVGRKSKSKMGLKPFNNEYQDRVLNLTDEKPLKDIKRHEHFIKKCEKTGYLLTQFVLFNLE